MRKRLNWEGGGVGSYREDRDRKNKMEASGVPVGEWAMGGR